MSESEQTSITSNPRDFDCDVSFAESSNGANPKHVSSSRAPSCVAWPDSSWVTSNLHDSDTDVSFIMNCGDKKSTVNLPVLIDKTISEANRFGKTLALHANHAFETLQDTDESSGEDSSDSRRATRHIRKAVLLMKKAGRYGFTASLQAANPCLGYAAMIQDEDGLYSSSDESRHTHRRRRRKKKAASEARPHGKLLAICTLHTTV